MLKVLYAYLMAPTKTVQVYSHVKDWRVWWTIILVSSVVSSIKVSSIGVFQIVSYGVLIASYLLVSALIIDGVAQIMGAESQFKTVLYWKGFAWTLFWFSPSVALIQTSFYFIGTLLGLILNVVYAVYLWKTLMCIYKLTPWRLVAIFLWPVFFFVIFFFSLFITLTQWVMALV